MTWLHTWTGLLLSWILFAIFVTGTATYYRHEITRWMTPERVVAGQKAPVEEVVRNAIGYLERNAEEQANWYMTLPDGRQELCSVSAWGNGGNHNALLNPVTGEAVKLRETRGGEFFYRFHFELQLPYPWGRYLAGVAALFMFVALLTGIVAHRQFFKEFFTFRPTRAWLRSCMDFHNVMAVLALPFYLVISFSALVIFMQMYLPWGRMLLEKTEAEAPASAEVVEVSPHEEGVMEKILLAVERKSPGQEVRRIFMKNRNTPQADVTVMCGDPKRVTSGRANMLRFDAATGDELPLTDPMADGVVGKTVDLLYGWHLAHFANPVTRAAFFVMGFMGAAMTGSGMLMWTQKRKTAQLKRGSPSIGYQLVDRLNIAGIAGLFLAIAAFFWANRVLPVGIAEREQWEVKCFLYTWGASLLHAWCRPVRKAWNEQLWLAALLFSALPVVDWITVSEWIKTSVSAGQGLFPVFDAVLFGIGAAFAWTAWKFSKREQPVTRKEN
ncbi:MAG: PepSY-associated TM helix domain-containing protein [Luteolibacter sp.]